MRRHLALSLARDYAPGIAANRYQGRRRERLRAAEAGRVDHAAGRIHFGSRRGGGREKLANILSGGRLTGEQTVSEQYLLDLEREAFLSLCGNPKTQERMQFMLKTGKPLRN